MKLIPGERISTMVRILEEPRSTSVVGKKLVNAKVGDGENIANLVAWDKETERWNLRKNDIIELINGECPKSHKMGHLPPTITIAPKTLIKKLDIKFPSIEECMRKKFLDQISEYEYGILEGFIVQIYRTVSYFCDKCKRFSDEMCECGNFPDPIFRISGVFSDGTKTMAFATISEKVAEDLTYAKKSDAKKINPHELVNRSYNLLGYVRNEKLYMEEVLK